MIDIETVVMVVLFLMGCAAIFGLLWYLIHYLQRKFPGGQPFWTAAEIFLVVAAVLVLIFLILDLMGHPVIVWRRP